MDCWRCQTCEWNWILIYNLIQLIKLLLDCCNCVAVRLDTVASVASVASVAADLIWFNSIHFLLGRSSARLIKLTKRLTKRLTRTDTRGRVRSFASIVVGGLFFSIITTNLIELNWKWIQLTFQGRAPLWNVKCEMWTVKCEMSINMWTIRLLSSVLMELGLELCKWGRPRRLPVETDLQMMIITFILWWFSWIWLD